MKLRLIATALAANLVAITAAIALDSNLPAYQAVSGISGQGMGDKANRDLRPQFHFRNLRVFQENCFIRRRL
jgi:hypothetical protein